MTTNAKRACKSLLLCVPLLLGVAGFIQAGEPVLDAVFVSLCLYGMEIQDHTPNLLVELARWTAPLATASGVLMLFTSVRRTFRASLRYWRGDSVAVYGPEEEKARLLDQLGRRGIDGEARFVRAQQYILLWDEAESFDFYDLHRDRLAGHVTYLRASALRAQECASPDLRIFCPEETAARLFWKERCLYHASAACGHRMKIVFLDFGRLGEELLLRALQNNIFHPDQRIEYHIFGDGAAFSAVHHQLSSITDPVLFHDEPWYAQRALLEEAQLVLVLSQEGQLALVRDLLTALKRRRIDVFTADGVGLDLLSERGRIAPYDWKQEAGKLEHIFSDKLFERAKQIHLYYAAKYDGVPRTEEGKEAAWRELDAFTRYSNISSADHHEIQRQMLSAMGQPVDAEQMSPQCLELLAHLEHIRWCRYHYLNNWRCGIPEGESTKDPERRIHKDLVPYAELTEEERQKDRDAVKVLLSL